MLFSRAASPSNAGIWAQTPQRKGNQGEKERLPVDVVDVDISGCFTSDAEDGIESKKRKLHYIFVKHQTSSTLGQFLVGFPPLGLSTDIF